MKDKFLFLLRCIVIVILLLKISNWFLHYEKSTNAVISDVMFVTLGSYFLVLGSTIISKWRKYTIVLCGLYLIFSPLLPDNTVFEIIHLVILLTPFVIARVRKSEFV